MYKFGCVFIDNGGKKQFFKVSANDKAEAIEKAFKKAKKGAKGEFISWDVKLIPGA